MSGKNPVVHFEMPYENHERLVSFYASAFGWQMNKLGEEMGGYVLASTTETDQNGMVQTPGAINGGFYPKQGLPGGVPAVPSLVIAVSDIKEAMANIVRSGGVVHGEPMPIPGVGQFVAFSDTEGNRASILQPLARDC